MKSVFTIGLAIATLIATTVTVEARRDSVKEDIQLHLKPGVEVFAFATVDQVTTEDVPPVCFCYVWKYFNTSKMYEMHCFDSYTGAYPIIYAPTPETAATIPYTCPAQPWPSW